VGLTISATATLIALSVFPVAAAEIVLDCTLDEQLDLNDVNKGSRPTPKAPIAIAFDDVSNGVTYIMNPIVRVLDTGNSVRKDEIAFAGEWVLPPKIIKHSGSVSRLTGRIAFYTEEVDERGRRIASTPWTMATGTCVAGSRKF
jgi:hypothetical protein